MLLGLVLLALLNVLVRTGYRVEPAAKLATAFPVGDSAQELMKAHQFIAIEQGHAVALQQNADFHELLVFSVLALGVLALASAVLGWITAGRVLRPLRVITTTTREISVGNLHRRLALDGPVDELWELGVTFDDLLERLEASFESQRHFVANASHELRTPLAVQRTLLQVALSDPESSEQALKETCEELAMLGVSQERLIDSLLTLAMSEQGIRKWHTFDLAAIARRVVEGRSSDARQKGVRLDARISPALAIGSAEMTEILVTNLLNNAIGHNIEGGWVELATFSPDPGVAVLHVVNIGQEIGAHDVKRLFEPFERLEGKRANDDGHGLGLAIVRAVARAHRAELSARARQGGGLAIEVRFRSPQAAKEAGGSRLPQVAS